MGQNKWIVIIIIIIDQNSSSINNAVAVEHPSKWSNTPLQFFGVNVE